MADPNPKTVAYGCTIFGICRDVPGAVLTDLIRTAICIRILAPVPH